MSAAGRNRASSASSASLTPRLAPKKGRTNGRACVNCHHRKVRCDVLIKGTPCSKCEANDIPDCRLFEKKKTRSSSARASNSPNVPLQPRISDGARSTTTPTASDAASPWINAAGDSGGVPTSTADSAAQSHYAIELATRNLADFLDQEETESQEILPSGRLYFIGTEFSNLNYLVRQRTHRPDQNVLHFGSHPLAPRMSSVPPEALDLPTKELADDLVEAYFVHVNRGFPIVNESQFMKKYNNVDSGSDTIRSRPLSLLLLNSILLVGAHVLSPQREDVKALKPIFFKRAKALFDCRFEQHRETYLQAALLLTWQCDDLEDVVSNSWYWVGCAVRTAFGMGIHRDATPSCLNIMDKLLWTRLWWTLYQFDVLVSMSHGRPQAINLDDSDVPMIAEHHLTDTPETETAFVIHHTRLCIIFSEAMRKRVSLRSTAEDRAKATREADTALAELVTNLPDSLQLSQSGPDIWQAIFHLTYNNFLILLHRPSPRPVPDQSTAEAGTDLSICSDAAATVSSIFEFLRKRNMLSGLWLPSIHVLFTALVHTSTQMHSSNPIVAAKSKRHSESMIQTLHSLKSQWLYARSLLNLFEPRHLRGRGHSQTNRPSGLGHDVSIGTDEAARQNGNSSASRSPDVFRYGNGNPSGSLSTAGRRPLSSEPTCLVHSTPNQGFSRSQEAQYMGTLAGDESQAGQFYEAGFVGDELSLGDVDNMGMLPLPSALEFLLAGGDNNFDFYS
ncbi:fungal specific transcription factor domain-containing protein [Colletotrichum graminicola]|uniref:Fungal specific transcription factor domain-containing protein n=1 Tax=Colletotrichum graminicola (strain M1.001 / M2 / FGSC 10212) TaxID=645133 RepID=E3QTQ4_COLGM|nr:fungal specific transcription factor domain-containing protein [Colletotrichum graminicola M1.001]EFQ34216.1 fungal specific transcription factor domain-containing protein [Colletotrichum graminicola M1.001]WDK12681.1 fungal specific transcription factor domain-containing protein [Colletotrichum graminicola]